VQKVEKDFLNEIKSPMWKKFSTKANRQVTILAQVNETLHKGTNTPSKNPRLTFQKGKFKPNLFSLDLNQC